MAFTVSPARFAILAWLLGLSNINISAVRISVMEGHKQKFCSVHIFYYVCAIINQLYKQTGGHSCTPRYSASDGMFIPKL